MAIPDYFTRAAIDDATFKATRFAADVETRSIGSPVFRRVFDNSADGAAGDAARRQQALA